MKRTLIALLALGGIAGAADYTWNGGLKIDAAAWAEEGNWILAEGVTWNTAGSGPGTTGSNMWGPIVINTPGAVVSDVSLEGWQPQISITNGASATLTMAKIQADHDIASFVVGAGSSLTLHDNGPYKDGLVTYTIEDAASLTVIINTTGTVSADSVFNLGSYGSAIFRSSENRTLGGTGNTINATLAKAVEGIAGDTIYTRKLIGLENVVFNNMRYNFGEGWDEVGSVDDITGFNQYAITSDASGIWVSYKLVPEPATATLSLLALAGLAARRRRK